MKLDTIKVGKIVGAHGIRGEVRVQPRDADPHMLTGFSTFLLDGQLVRPTANHVHKNIVLMKFPGVDDMNAALALRDKVLSIRRSDAHLPEGVYFDDELLGLDVFDADTGARLGELVAVEPYPAHKVYTVRGEREYLIPAVSGAVIVSTDLLANLRDVHVREGMPRHEH